MAKTPMLTGASFICALLVAVPAWAVHKCAGPYGQTIFQDAPCAGSGITVAEDVARKQAAVARKKEEQEQEAAARQAKEDAEREAFEAKRKAAGYKSPNERITEARARCNNGLPEYPTIGMTEFEFLNCTTWGVVVRPDTVNQTETALGTSKQYVYPSGREIRYLYVRNGLVSAIQR